MHLDGRKLNIHQRLRAYNRFRWYLSTKIVEKNIHLFFFVLTCYQQPSHRRFYYRTVFQFIYHFRIFFKNPPKRARYGELKEMYRRCRIVRRRRRKM